jgi:probable phosphoglycerate mutase
MILPDGQEHYPVLSLYQQAQDFWREIIPQHEGKLSSLLPITALIAV